MSFIIKTDNLKKVYDGKIVVDDLNLKIPRGSIFGFLGPNGAGKTTTIKMLTGILKPNSGSAFFNNLDCFK